MKKALTLFFALLLCAPVFARYQVRIEKEEPDSSSLESVAYRTNANHWSIAVHGGIGLLDGDQRQDMFTMVPRSKPKFSFGVNVEYTVNPNWGVYVEYLYNQYAGYIGPKPIPSYIGVGNYPALDFSGINHEAVIGLSFDLLNLVIGHRPQIVNWYANIGVGASFYSVDGYLPGTTEIIESIPWSERGRSFSLPIGTTVEFNATDWLAIFLNAEYRVHHQDLYDLRWSGHRDDNIAYGGIGLRWKINSSSRKNRVHVREMSVGQYSKDESTAIAKQNTKRLGELENKVQAVQDEVDELGQKVDVLEPRVKTVEDDVKNLRDSDNDGVPDVRDRHPNTPAGAFVNEYGEPVKRRSFGTAVPDDSAAAASSSPSSYPSSSSSSAPTTGKDGRDGRDRYVGGSGNAPAPAYAHAGGYVGDLFQSSIYFATSKTDINASSHTVLANIARYMYAESDVKLEIHGYADEQGAPRYSNQRLSERRAKAVRDILVKKYGIPEDRIVLVKGYGAIAGPTKDYLPNRRVDLIFE
jgi:outer membrane protein OmpA-like peptidoglycan-associated protein